MPNTNDKCANCGASYGVHQHQTDKCPEGGYDSGKFKASTTTFVPAGLTAKDNAEARIEALERRITALEQSR